VIEMLAAIALSIASALSPATTEPPPIPDGYVPLVDATGLLVVAVPESWTEVDPLPAVRDGVAQPYLAASPDLDVFLTSFDAPGVMYAAFPFVADPTEVLRAHGLAGGCATLEVKTYDDPVFTGIVQVGTDCGAAHMTWNMVVATPADQSFTAVVQVQSAPDDEATRIVMLTFNVAPGAVATFDTVPPSTTTSTAP
jgi:hypothetical protein